MPFDAVNAAVKAQILAEALPYIQRFHDKTIIALPPYFKIGRAHV